MDFFSLKMTSFFLCFVFNFALTREKLLSVSLDYGMTALVAIISGQLQVFFLDGYGEHCCA